MSELLDIVPHDCDLETVDPAITWSFPLDFFQKQAQFYIQKSEHVLVTAHTSAGKTVVAECAIAFAKKRERRVFYTSPIKTLSNQKYAEFGKKFGLSDVGLLTGDIKCNPDAQCVIMTTEILRDMLFKNHDLSQLDAVVFDEIHYINDPDRGHVWEECLLMLPNHVTIVGLSATISESHKFAQWIAEKKQKPIHLISTVKRPVPLNHFAFSGNKHHLILDSDGVFHEDNYRIYTELAKGGDGNLLNTFLKYLRDQKFAPAIFFVFSRRKCEVYAQQVGISLVDQKEQAIINHEISTCLAKHSIPKDLLEKMPQVNRIRYWAERGIGVHHSGLLPILKEIVEILFTKGLIKVLFATETFAVGVNTPTRTVVFTDLSKHTSESDQSRILRPHEYLQMSGRAGRRGLDKFGIVIHLPLSEVYDLAEVRTLLLGKSPRIDSKFKINFAFILQNLTNQKNDVTIIINQSYLSQQHHESLRLLEIDREKAKISTEKLQSQLDQYPTEIVDDLKRLVDLESKVTTVQEINGFAIKNNKNHDKKLKTEINILNKKIQGTTDFGIIKSTIQSQIEIQEQISNIDTDMLTYEHELSAQTTSCLNQLRALNYIHDEKLTQSGVIASKIMSANEILVTDLIVSGYLRDLDIASIAGILSIFCENSGMESEKEFNRKGLSTNMLTVLDWVYEQAEYYAQTYPCYVQEFSDQPPDHSLVHATHRWVNGCTYFEVLPMLETYEGNFIRNMLRLSHICEEIIGVCEIIQDAILEKKMKDLKTVLIRDPVNFDSLYLRI